MTAIRNNERRASIASILLIVYLAFNLIDGIICYIQYDLFFRVKYYGHVITDEQASADDIRNRVALASAIILYILCIITFLNWLRRAYYNLETQVKFTNYTNKQAVYYWFIPILALYKPYRLTKDLFEETDNILCERIASYQIQTPKTMLAVWWSFWIVNNIFANVVLRVPADNIEDYMTKDILEMISNGICIAAGIFLLLLIKKYHSMEKLLSETALEIPEENSTNETYPDGLGPVTINENA